MGLIVTRPAGSSQAIIKEQATGAIDGNNAVFTTSQNYFPGSLTVYFNGVRERYATPLGGNQFQMPANPRIGSVIDVEYVRN